jgi:iron transport multicopper oxidase
MSDWYHEQMPTLLQYYLSAANKGGVEPMPNSALLNDAQNIKFHVIPGRTYLVRVINMAAFVSSFLHFDGHLMTIVEIDGVYTEPKTADFLYLAAGQRYSVLIHAQPNAAKNYAFLASIDDATFKALAPGLNPNVTGFLVYDGSKPLPRPPVVTHFTPINDLELVPLDGQRRLGKPDVSITLDLNFAVGADGVRR